MANYSNRWNFKGGAVFIAVALVMFVAYRLPIATQEQKASFVSASPSYWSKSRGLDVKAQLTSGETVAASTRPGWYVPQVGASIILEDRTSIFGFHIYYVVNP